MIYSNHFVMCVLVNGKPLKERADGIVTIPLGAEYTIRFKNKNSRRAVVKFSIDGEEASGNGYIIDAHNDVEIKRFADRDQMFKFVDLNSGEAQLEGKNGPNTDGSKGVIEAKFYLEKEAPKPTYTPLPIPYPVPQPYPVPYPAPYPWPRRSYPYNGPVWNDNTYGSGGPFYMSHNSGTKGMSCGGGGTMSSCNVGGFEACAATGETWNDAVQTSFTSSLHEGVTVGGQVTGQTFRTVAFEAETDFVMLRLVLRGTNEPVPVAEVTEAEYCSKCGKKRPKNANFCDKCGNKF